MARKKKVKRVVIRRKPFTAKSIDKIGMQLREVAGAVVEFASQLSRDGFDGKIVVDAGAGVLKGMAATRDWLAKLQKEYAEFRSNENLKEAWENETSINGEKT